MANSTAEFLEQLFVENSVGDVLAEESGVGQFLSTLFKGRNAKTPPPPAPAQQPQATPPARPVNRSEMPTKGPARAAPPVARAGAETVNLKDKYKNNPPQARAIPPTRPSEDSQAPTTGNTTTVDQNSHTNDTVPQAEYDAYNPEQVKAQAFKTSQEITSTRIQQYASQLVGKPVSQQMKGHKEILASMLDFYDNIVQNVTVPSIKNKMASASQNLANAYKSIPVSNAKASPGQYQSAQSPQAATEPAGSPTQR